MWHSRPPRDPPLHGKYHLKFPFWLSATVPKLFPHCSISFWYHVIPSFHLKLLSLRLCIYGWISQVPRPTCFWVGEPGYGWMWPAELDHFTRPQPFFISAPRSDLGWEVKVKTAATPHSTKTGGQRCLTILRDRNLLERQPGCLSMAFLSTCGRVRRLSARFFPVTFFILFPQRLPVP